MNEIKAEWLESPSVELERYHEAVTPLRQADFGLVKEAMEMFGQVSPTMGLISQTIENLLEIFDPHEPQVRQVADNITATCVGDAFQYYCKNCDVVYVRETDRLKRCPGCGWKRGFGLRDDSEE